MAAGLSQFGGGHEVCNALFEIGLAGRMMQELGSLDVFAERRGPEMRRPEGIRL